MCNKCYQPFCGGTCNENPCESGCPIKLDFACIVYNKDGKEASKLSGLNLPNGSTLRLVVELLDEKIKQLDVVNYALPHLRQSHVINNVKKFAEVVDSTLASLRSDILSLSSESSPNVIGIASSSINLATSGTQGHTIKADLKLSASEGNTLTILGDGLYNNPQTLGINYLTKSLTISNGNSVDLTPLVQAPSGYLGKVIADPSSPLDGNYWFNSSQNKLKIRVGDTIKEIVTL